MDTLLASKFRLPKQKDPWIDTFTRNEKFALDKRIIHIQGGPATGKTTLLAAFLREEEKGVYFALEEGDGFPQRFFHPLLYALEGKVAMDLPSLREAFLSAKDEKALKSVLAFFLNALAEEEGSLYIAVDNLHHVESDTLVEALSMLITHAPDNVRLLFASRKEHPVQLHDFVVKGEAVVFDEAHLLFEKAESLAFLNEKDKELCYEEAERIHALAKGWVGGLQLLLVARMHGMTIEEDFTTLAGPAVDYLNETVYRTFPPKIREAFLQLAPLRAFGAAALRKLTDIEEGDVLLREIAREHMVIEASSDNAEYSFHPLFRAFLLSKLRELPVEEGKPLFAKIARFHEENAEWDKAVDNHLKADCAEDAMRVLNHAIDDVADEALMKIPVEFLKKDFDLSIRRAFYHLMNLEIGEGEKLLESLLPLHKDAHGDFIKLFLAILRQDDIRKLSLTGKNASGETITEWIDHLRLSKTTKIMLELHIAVQHFYRDEFAIALSLGKDALRYAKERKNPYLECYARLLEAQIHEHSGRLAEARQSFYEIERLIGKAPVIAPIRAAIHAGKAGVFLKGMHLDKAEELLKKALAEEKAGFHLVQLGYMMNMMEIHTLRGDEEKALAMFKRLHETAEIEKSPFFAHATRYLMHFEGTEEYLESFRRIYAEKKKAGVNRIEDELVHIELAVLDKACDESHEENLRKLLERLRKERLSLYLVEALLVKARMKEAAGDEKGLFNTLFEAIHYASKEGLYAPFVLRGNLLKRHIDVFLSKRSDRLEEGGARFVFRLAGYIRPKEHAAFGLTEREREVLGLMVRGLSNQRITEDLHISIATIKTHINRIYGKLGVKNRMEALKKAAPLFSHKKE